MSDPPARLLGMSLLLLLKSQTVEPNTDTEAEAIARRLGMGQVAPHYVYELRAYPPTPEGGYLVELRNQDTGLVDLAIHEDPAEAFRRLAEPFADDL
jgi:hypothetical protein